MTVKHGPKNKTATTSMYTTTLNYILRAIIIYAKNFQWP